MFGESMFCTVKTGQKYKKYIIIIFLLNMTLYGEDRTKQFMWPSEVRSG